MQCVLDAAWRRNQNPKGTIGTALRPADLCIPSLFARTIATCNAKRTTQCYEAALKRLRLRAAEKRATRAYVRTFLLQPSFATFAFDFEGTQYGTNVSNRCRIDEPFTAAALCPDKGRNPSQLTSAFQALLREHLQLATPTAPFNVTKLR